MELRTAGLKEQPFRQRGEPLAFFGYAGQERAHDFFEHTWRHNSGLGLFQGPQSSGKSTLIAEYAKRRSEDCEFAIVDGEGRNPTGFLEAVLREFGFQHQFDTVNELISMITVFIKQQTAAGRSPMLFVENVHAMNPAAMNALCDLASIRVREKFAIRIVLCSDRNIEYIAEAPAMTCISKRLTGNFHLEPLTIDETSDYLYAKLRQGGCIDPDFVFPDAVCDALFHASGGWPGILDQLALLAIDRATECPVQLNHIAHPRIPKSTRPDHSDIGELAADEIRQSGPLIFLTKDGETIRKIRFSGSRLLLGRSEHNDVRIESKFVSRHHALLVRHGNATLLMDLNSANGTFVNSRRVSNQVLANDDILTVGDYGLKFVDPTASRRESLEGISLDDTIVMMTLDDMRRVLARENTVALPIQKKSPGESA